MSDVFDARVDVLTNEAVIFRHINGPGTDVMQAIFQAFYSCPEMDSGAGKMTLGEYKIDKQMSNRAFDNLGQYVQSAADVDLMNTRKDISFYYMVITKLNIVLYNRLPEISKQLLKELKEERNNSCHSDQSSNMSSVEEKLENLEKLYSDLLDAFESTFPNNNYLQRVRSILPSLLTRMRNEPVDPTIYRTEREKFFKELQKTILLDGQNELAIQPVFGNCRDPFSKLIKLHCISNKREDPFVDVFTSPWIQDGQRKTALEVMLNIKDDDGKCPRVIFLAGQGGSGKSTIGYKMFREWQNKAVSAPSINGLEKMDLVFYVVLKYVFSHCLEDLITKELLVDTLKGIVKRDAIPVIKNLNVLFLLDGFDEMKQECKGLVEEMSSRLPNCRLLLTTRSEYLKEAQTILQRSTFITLDLHGLDELNQSQFAEKVLALVEPREDISRRMHDNFCLFLNSRRQVLKVHLKLPLTLALLIFLWLEYKDTPEKLQLINTATQLYRQLFEMLKEKLVRIRTLFAAVSEKAVDRVFHELKSTALTQVTEDLDLQLSNQNYSRMIAICTETSLINEDQQTEFLSAFLICDIDDNKQPAKKMTPINEKPPFSFFHRTQMEYFSAEHIVGELKKKNKTQLQDCLLNDDKRRYKEVIPFIAGVLRIEGLLQRFSEELVQLTEDADVQDDDYNFFFNMINETGILDSAGDIAYDEDLCNIIGQKLSYQLWQLKPETLIAGLNLLIYCEKIEISKLEIDCRINDDLKNIHGLREVLENAKVCLGERFGAAKIDLSLHIRVHRSISVEDRSDPYLYYFLPWTNIVKFTGHIEKEAVEHLSSCGNIDVKLSSLDAFNALMERCPSFKNLRKLTLTSNFLISLEDDFVRPLPRHKGEFCMEFYDVNSNCLDRVLTFITRSTSSQKAYYRLGVYRSSLDYASGVRLFASLQGLVSNKLTVQSTVELTDEQERSIMREALREQSFSQSTFVAVWNTRKIVGWDRSYM